MIQTQGDGLLETQVHDRSNLATSTDVTSRVRFSYDALARVTSTTDWLQLNTQTDGFELKSFYADKVDRRTSTQSRFVQYLSGGTTESGDQWDFRNTYVWNKLNRVDLITQQSANNPLSAMWPVFTITTASATSPVPMIRRRAQPMTVTCPERNELATNTHRNAAIPAENRIPPPA